MLRLAQEAEINGSQVEKDREPGHHNKIKTTETSQGTETIIQKIEHTEILWEITEM